ncbi:dienelactone hydrolase family protein [Haloarcula amylovorans]|uniref:dienelactone hydrolase family protein n=1 Tax=Haloarcula amylovorans TaxID=2562280 RepID=UPI0010760E83|nr:hypothetical protein [Halomicroarcula amylolytica]
MRDGETGRRAFLGGTVAVLGAIGLAGCLGDETSESDGTAIGTETAADTSTAEPTQTPAETAESTPTEPRDVLFEAPHGATVEATAYGSGDCGVALVPQINLDRESWRPLAERIAERGRLALAVDEDPENRAASVRGAVRYLREQAGVSTLVLVGASSGGEAVLRANATTEFAVDGTVTLSAAGGTDRAADLQGRTLFVVSTGDDDRFVRTARRLHEEAPDPAELVEYDGSAHGQAILDSAHGDDLRRRMRRFIADACGE